MKQQGIKTRSENIMNKIVYIAELDADVDDVIAAEYLHKCGF